MKNIITTIPSMGDIAFLDEAKNLKFIEAGSFDPAVFTGETIGVVAWRRGADVFLVHKTAKDLVWSEGYYWKTSGWQLDGSEHSCTISFYESQKAPSSPTFTYKANSIVEVVAQLLGWFDAYANEGGLRYNVIANEDGTIEVILEKYANWYEYILNISGISVSYDTGVELPALTDGYAINGKGGYYKGMNWDKFVDYMKTTDSSSFNPSEPVHSLPTNPVSLPAFLGDNCAYLREVYGGGEEGWLKCLAGYMIQHPTMRGIFGDGYKDGEKNTALLAGKTFTKTTGEVVPSYPAANYCANIGYDNAEVAKGRWHLPTMDELAKIVAPVKLDYSDIVNKSLSAIGGDRITFRDFWSCCRYGVGTAWYFNGWHGYANYDAFSYRLSVLPCCFIKIHECE